VMRNYRWLPIPVELPRNADQLSQAVLHPEWLCLVEHVANDAST
jgi:hypothetical protein